MEPITLQGNEIIDIKVMHQSKRARVTIELTEEDTKQLAGALMAWRANGLLFDSSFIPSEIEGNDNGFEGSLIKKKRERSIYETFRLKCIEYSGEDYYERLKQHLGVEKMSDLERRHSYSVLKNILEFQAIYLFWKQIRSKDSGNYSHEAIMSCIDSSTYKDGSYDLWKKLFDEFNNP